MRRIPFLFPSRLPWGLLGMIVLVATTELLLTRSRFDLTTSSSACWHHAGQRACQAREAQILCFGTSLVKTGILPRIIEERTGQRATNLAVYSGPIPASYFLLRRALRAGARPSALILDCQNLAEPGRRREEEAASYLLDSRLWADLLDVRECLDLAWSTRDADFFVKTMLSWTLPSVKARFEIRASVLAALQGRSGSSREFIRALERNWAVNRGTHVFPHVERPSIATDKPAEVARLVDPETIAPDDRLLETLTGQYARRLVALADLHRITIFWLLPPLPAEEQAKRTEGGEDACLIRLARTMQVHARNLVIVDGRPSRFDPRVFADTVHLDSNGAAVFSDEVGSVVARYFTDPSTTPPVVTLPRYRDSSPDLSLVEDMLKSLIMVR